MASLIADRRSVGKAELEGQEWLRAVDARRRLKDVFEIDVSDSVMSKHRDKDDFDNRPGGVGCHYEVEWNSFLKWAVAWNKTETDNGRLKPESLTQPSVQYFPSAFRATFSRKTDAVLIPSGSVNPARGKHFPSTFRKKKIAVSP